MSKFAKSATALTWVSRGPVQINVGRDFHLHGAAAAASDVPDGCVLPRANAAPGFVAAMVHLGSAVKLFVSAGWFLTKVAFWVLVGLLVLCVVLPAMALALSLWLLARIAELPLFLERRLGGGPLQLVYVPWLPQSRYRVPTPLDRQELDSSEVELLEPGNSVSSAAAMLQAPSVATRACLTTRPKQP